MLKIIIFAVITLNFIKFSEQFANTRVEDEKFWRKQGESYLKKILDLGDDAHNYVSAKNIIIFIGDGMGMTSITAGRIFKGQQRGLSGEEGSLVFDNFPNIGLAKTYNVDKQVPDSAGTATAIFSGVKTRYGVIGMDNTTSIDDATNGRLTSIMDWALSVGKRTGIVTTTRVTHATPAATYANIHHRDWECDTKIEDGGIGVYKDIAVQLVEDLPGRKFNVILAGGRTAMGSPEERSEIDMENEIKFYGQAEKLCTRDDGRNLVEEWLELKPTEKRKYVKDREELMSTDTSNVEHLLGLFNNNHMSYAIVREKDKEPTLPEMVKKALGVLNRPKSNGFVLMVEGGRIDQAHHQNHARGALTELLELDEAVQVALDATKRTDTLVIVTADHSHAMTLNGYPKRGNDILGFANKENKPAYETLSYANGPGFWSHRVNTTNETKTLADTWIRLEDIKEERELPTYRHLASLPLKDETHGGEDIPVYAVGPGAHLIRGVFEQSYLAYVMSYTGCMGPVRHLNQYCTEENRIIADRFVSSEKRNGCERSKLSTLLVFILVTVILL